MFKLWGDTLAERSLCRPVFLLPARATRQSYQLINNKSVDNFALIFNILTPLLTTSSALSTTKQYFINSANALARAPAQRAFFCVSRSVAGQA